MALGVAFFVLFTALWAAKEAVLRSLGTKWRKGICWTDLEVRLEKGETPTVRVGGALEELQISKGVGRFLLSTAHCRTFATATCIAVK